MSDPVDYVPFETTTTPVGGEHNADAPELERLYDVPVELAVEIGRTHMVMLPPVFISLPFKILLFVLVDGWNLITRSLVESFH